jgi:hypothetical protein
MGCPFSPAAGMDAEIFLYIAVKKSAVNRADGGRADLLDLARHEPFSYRIEERRANEC